MRRQVMTGLAALLLALGAATGSYAQDRGPDRPGDHQKQGQRQDRDKKSGGNRQPDRERRDSRDGKSSGGGQGTGNRDRTGGAERSRDRTDTGRARNGERAGSDRRTRTGPKAGNGEQARVRERPSGDGTPRTGERRSGPSASSRPRTGTRTRTHVQLPSTPERVRQWQQDQRGQWQRHRAGHFDSEHRSWTQRGGYRGYRIRESRYSRHFGRDHFFRVYPLPFMVVGGFPRFQYAGYWFIVVEPYPEYWGPDWYRSDEVYIEFVDDGYYLFNRRFPSRPGIAIRIAF